MSRLRRRCARRKSVAGVWRPTDRRMRLLAVYCEKGCRVAEVISERQVRAWARRPWGEM